MVVALCSLINIGRNRWEAFSLVLFSIIISSLFLIDDHLGVSRECCFGVRGIILSRLIPSLWISFALASSSAFLLLILLHFLIGLMYRFIPLRYAGIVLYLRIPLLVRLVADHFEVVFFLFLCLLFSCLVLLLIHEFKTRFRKKQLCALQVVVSRCVSGYNSNLSSFYIVNVFELLSFIVVGICE